MPPKPNKKAGKAPKKDAKDQKGNIKLEENGGEDSVCSNFGAFYVKEEPSQFQVCGAFAIKETASRKRSDGKKKGECL